MQFLISFSIFRFYHFQKKKQNPFPHTQTLQWLLVAHNNTLKTPHLAPDILRTMLVFLTSVPPWGLCTCCFLCQTALVLNTSAWVLFDTQVLTRSHLFRDDLLDHLMNPSHHHTSLCHLHFTSFIRLLTISRYLSLCLLFHRASSLLVCQFHESVISTVLVTAVISAARTASSTQ